MIKAIQIIVIGKVQGVGFRYYTQKRAQQYEVRGYVQNKADGSVYIEAEGKESDIKALADWCQRGPAWSRVKEVKVSEIPEMGFSDFEVR
ncbi:MAG: acylphosphatase [Bacteroidetes bacterium 4572_77]|nr:MAG: acylphosphatase [Bacteroidetes bacterium 4572_77]